MEQEQNIPSYQHGNPHKLNSQVKPQEIIFDPFPEITIKKNQMVQVPDANTKPQKLNDYLDKMKYIASQ